jgi:hypothetical protein
MRCLRACAASARIGIDMTREDLLADLRQLEQLFDDSIIINRVIIAPGVGEVCRIQRIAYHPRGTEPPRKG